MNRPRLRAYTYLILATLIWGLASPIIKFTLSGIDPLPFISYRLTISAFISIVCVLLKIRRGKKFRQLSKHFPLALLYGLLAVPAALGLLFLGLDNTTVLDLTLIGVIGPMIVALGAAKFFRERITKKEKIGITIVLLGVLLNSLFPLISAQGVRLTANILLLAYLLSDSGSILLAKRASRRKINSANLTNLAFIVGAITMVPLTILVYGFDGLYQQLAHLPLKYHFGVWYMAVFSGTIAYFLYIRAQRSIEVSEGVLFNYLQPVVTIPLAVFWLGEKITFHYIFGAILIVIGLVIAESKKRSTKTIKP